MENPFDPNPFAGHTACCFTGHRPAGLPQSAGGMAALRLALMRVVQAACDGGVRTFLAGGAQGFDQLAAEAVLLLRDGLPDVRLLLALPSPAQADGWSDAARARYGETLRRADGVWYAATGAPDAAATAIWPTMPIAASPISRRYRAEPCIPFAMRLRAVFLSAILQNSSKRDIVPSL